MEIIKKRKLSAILGLVLVLTLGLFVSPASASVSVSSEGEIAPVAVHSKTAEVITVYSHAWVGGIPLTYKYNIGVWAGTLHKTKIKYDSNFNATVTYKGTVYCNSNCPITASEKEIKY